MMMEALHYGRADVAKLLVDTFGAALDLKPNTVRAVGTLGVLIKRLTPPETEMANESLLSSPAWSSSTSCFWASL